MGWGLQHNIPPCILNLVLNCYVIAYSYAFYNLIPTMGSGSCAQTLSFTHEGRVCMGTRLGTGCTSQVSWFQFLVAAGLSTFLYF